MSRRSTTEWNGMEMFYLTTHSTHFLNLRLYVVGYMVKDHSDSERGNPLLPHGLLFPINSKGSFICTIPQTGLHIPWPLLHQSWQEREIAQWVHPMKDQSDEPSHHEQMLHHGATSHYWQMMKEGMFYLMMHSTHFIYG